MHARARDIFNIKCSILEIIVIHNLQYKKKYYVLLAHIKKKQYLCSVIKKNNNY